MSKPIPENPTTAVTVAEDKSRNIEYVPFGAKEKIKLSVAMTKSLLAVKTKTGRTCSDADAIKFLSMCQARLLNPWEGDAFLVGYENKDNPNEPKFSMITAHQAFLKRAEVNAEYDGMESGIVIEVDGQPFDRVGDFKLPNEKLLGGWARVHFKTRKHPMYKRLAMAQRKPSGYNSQFWSPEKEPEQICKCAEADALRASFPTMLGGLYLREELVPGEPVKATVTPIFDTPSARPALEEPKESPVNPVEDLRKLLDESEVSEEEVIGFLIAIGLANDEHKSLDDVHKAMPESIPLAIEKWEDFKDRIKSA